jgi:DNA-directed RNA polymerase subunit RPC12/RpoP
MQIRKNIGVSPAMKMYVLRCPNCEASVEIEDGIDIFQCKHCGYKIVMDGQSEASLNAKVLIKEMEHSERLKEKELSQERYIIEQKAKEKSKTRKLSALSVIAIIVGAIIVSVILFFIISHFTYILSLPTEHEKEELRFQKTVQEIQIDINNKDFDSAHSKAISLIPDGIYSDEYEKKWNVTRKTTIKKIKEARKRNLKIFKDAKGKNYREVMAELHDAGYTNTESVPLNDLTKDWLKKKNDVSKISINGIADINDNTKFFNDAKIVITYHTYEKK